MTQATTTIPAPPRAAEPWGLAARTLWQRELVRFFRQRNRVIGALATPLLFWLLLGFGLDRAVSIPLPAPSHGESLQNIGYMEYFFPGTIVLMLLFTAIFSTITVIEDRREGFLQAVLVAPIHRSQIVMGKALGGATIAVIQATALLALWPLIHGWPGLATMLGALLVSFLVAFCLTALSLCLAWPMDSTAGFHAVMNLLLLPMWFLSGAIFPAQSAHPAIRWLVWINPLTYGHAALTALLHNQKQGTNAPIPLSVSVSLLLLFAVLAVIMATRVVSRPRKDGLA